MTADDLPAILGGQPIRPQGPPAWPGYDPDVAAAVEAALADGSWGQYHGPQCEALAERLADYHGCEHAILCCSGTAAIELALRGLRVGVGDEVVLAAYDFKGNFQDVLAIGATPVLVDVAADHCSLDPNLVESAIGPATKAMIVSHLHGGVAHMSLLMEMARRRGIPVIEDACQMPGAMIEGQLAGTTGDVGIHSFGGSKLLSAGRGGAIVTDDAEVVQRIKLYSQRGNEAYPLSELQAAALRPQIDALDSRNRRRAENIERLRNLLEDCEGLNPLNSGSIVAKPGYYKFGLFYRMAAFEGITREQFSAAMRAEGVAIDPGFRAFHRIHSRRRFRSVGELTNAESADECLLTLHHPILLRETAEIDEFIGAIEKIRRHATMIREQSQNQ